MSNKQKKKKGFTKNITENFGNDNILFLNKESIGHPSCMIPFVLRKLGTLIESLFADFTFKLPFTSMHLFMIS